jgi:hypothetical protein
MTLKTAVLLTTTWATTSLTAGCAHFAPAAQSLAVRTEGLGATQSQSVAEITPGQPIHRVLRNNSGKVLFAYDLDVAKYAPGTGPEGATYRFLLKPAEGGPTFAAAREVNVIPENEAVRVELMVQPGTTNKVVDVFSLSASPATAENTGFVDHLMAMHNHLFKWLHGK